MMRCQLFTDPMYDGDRYIEFDPAEIIAIEAKTVSLFLRGKRSVTAITLRNGGQYILQGDVAAEIATTQRQARAARKHQRSS